MKTFENTIGEIQIGTEEATLHKIMKPYSNNKGSVYWGGSGAKRVYFEINNNRQIWFEIGGSFDKSLFGKVSLVGKIEPKSAWTKLQ